MNIKINKPVFGVFVIAFIAVMSFLIKPSRAATIYECRAYNGESFWSNAPCRTHNALTASMHPAPDDIPFEQQVDLIQKGIQRANNTRTAESQERERLAGCNAVNRGLKELDSKYSNWQYVPIDQVNADQAQRRH